MEDTQNTAVNASGAENITASSTGDITPGVVQATTGTNTFESNSNSSEGTLNAESETNEGEGNIPKAIPYERFAESRAEIRELRQQLAEAQQYRELVNVLKEKPEIAGQFLGLMPEEPEDPRVEQAMETLKNKGVVTMDTLEQFLSQRDVAKEFQSTVTKLEQEINGADGRPKFVGVEVARFMDTYGVTDPSVAYELMHKDALAEYRAQEAKKKASSTYSERPGQSMQSVGQDDYEALKEQARTGDENALDQIFKRRASSFLSKLTN